MVSSIPADDHLCTVERLVFEDCPLLMRVTNLDRFVELPGSDT